MLERENGWPAGEELSEGGRKWLRRTRGTLRITSQLIFITRGGAGKILNAKFFTRQES
jgi:hypothetical protein